MAYVFGKVTFLVGVKVDDDNEQLGIEQANYQMSEYLNIGYVLNRINHKGESIKVDICEPVGEIVMDSYED